MRGVAGDRRRLGPAPALAAIARGDLPEAATDILAQQHENAAVGQSERRWLLELAVVERCRGDGWSPASAAVAGADDENALIGRNIAERQHQLAIGQFRGPAHAISADERRGVEPDRFPQAAPPIPPDLPLATPSPPPPP